MINFVLRCMSVSRQIIFKCYGWMETTVFDCQIGTVTAHHVVILINHLCLYSLLPLRSLKRSIHCCHRPTLAKWISHATHVAEVRLRKCTVLPGAPTVGGCCFRLLNFPSFFNISCKLACSRIQLPFATGLNSTKLRLKGYECRQWSYLVIMLLKMQ